MIKILIIGKRGFIGNKLAEYLKDKFLIKHISFNNFKSKKEIVNDFNWIINSSINKDYINQKYNKIFDNDLKIAEYIRYKKISYIFLSTRKVYKRSENIKESGSLNPRSNYSKNKLISEKKIHRLSNFIHKSRHLPDVIHCGIFRDSLGHIRPTLPNTEQQF